MNYWYTQQHKWISKLSWLKEVRQKRIHTMWFHLHKTENVNQPEVIQRRLVVARKGEVAQKSKREELEKGTETFRYDKCAHYLNCDWSRVQPRGGPQEGICNGVQDSGCPGNIRKMYIGCPHPYRPEPGGMGHMEQGHSELFWVATAL